MRDMTIVSVWQLFTALPFTFVNFCRLPSSHQAISHHLVLEIDYSFLKKSVNLCVFYFILTLSVNVLVNG
jgi:hypothetical protein